ncbi:MAG: imidazolonepropionase [Pseudomonadota bacterium]
MRLIHGTLATMIGGAPYGLIPDGAIEIRDGRLAWIGPTDKLEPNPDGTETVDLAGRVVTPGLIDCHTHLVHGGNRAREFELRLQGASYEQIAREGGGIASTVAATREASEVELLEGALARVDGLMAEGVSCIEVKSGYGLDVETECRMLRVARRIEALRPVRVRTSFLGAHAVPRDYAGRASAYLTGVCLPALHAAQAEGLVDAVDGFCERIAFSADEIRMVFEAAQDLDLPVKLHAEQLSHQGGTAMATRFGAMSVDHLEHATEADAQAMVASGTVAVLLPGAFYTLRDTHVPPVDAFRANGVPMAVATDLNPGSSPLQSLLLAMNMACTLFRLTPEEALAGTTTHAARALGLTDTGRIQPGLRADLAVWDIESPAELSYRIGANPLHMRIFGGERCP